MATKTKPVAVNPVDEFFNQLNAYLDSEGSLSIAKIAEAVGVSRQHIYELKERRSKPSFELVAKLTKVMGGRIQFDFSEKSCHV